MQEHPMKPFETTTLLLEEGTGKNTEPEGKQNKTVPEEGTENNVGNRKKERGNRKEDSGKKKQTGRERRKMGTGNRQPEI